MDASRETAQPATDLERLIVDLFQQEHLVCTISAGDNLAVAELMGKNTPSFGHGWWKVETTGWHIHAQLAAVARVQFVREPSNHVAGQESLSVRFVGADGTPLLRAYFTRLYDDDRRPVAARFAAWEALRARYGGGQPEVSVENGAFAASAGSGAHAPSMP